MANRQGRAIVAPICFSLFLILEEEYDTLSAWLNPSPTWLEVIYRHRFMQINTKINMRECRDFSPIIDVLERPLADASVCALLYYEHYIAAKNLGLNNLNRRNWITGLLAEGYKRKMWASDHSDNSADETLR